MSIPTLMPVALTTALTWSLIAAAASSTSSSTPLPTGTTAASQAHGPAPSTPFNVEDSTSMFKGEKVDICIFGFIVIMICVISGLFSCLINVISKQMKQKSSRNRFLAPEFKTGFKSYSATAETEHILY